MKIYFMDGGRHRQATGYGACARAIINGLLSNNVTLELQKNNKEYEVDFRKDLKYVDSPSDGSIVFQIGVPTSFKKVEQPTIGYTNCDISDFPSKWLDPVKSLDAIIAPNKINYGIFSKYVPLVYLAQDGVDTGAFKSNKRFRAEGSDKFTFICIGSYSFRKGSELLIEAFLNEFTSDEARLHLHIQPQQVDSCSEVVFRKMEQLGKLGNFRITSNSVSEAWLSRWINRTDCFVLPTRGEGWGHPVCEAMLCEKPVIVPKEMGIRDYIDDDCAFILDTKKVFVNDVESDFGAGFKQTYSDSGLYFWEPTIKSIRQQMRAAYSSDKEVLEEMGKKGRKIILDDFTADHFGERVFNAIQAFEQVCMTRGLL